MKGKEEVNKEIKEIEEELSMRLINKDKREAQKCEGIPVTGDGGIYMFPVKYVNRVHITSKTVPVTGRGALQDCDTSRIPHCLDSQQTDGGEDVSLTRRPPYNPAGSFVMLISLRGSVGPGTRARLEALGQFHQE
jgi:hypothetical protein